MEQWYGLTQEEVLKRLSTNRTGLSEEEAEKRLEVYGENILKEQEEMPWWQILFLISYLWFLRIFCRKKYLYRIGILSVKYGIRCPDWRGCPVYAG